MNIADFRIPPFLETILERNKITTFTEVQLKSIPLILEGTPAIIALAPTGSGKTLAYLLPLLVHLDKDPASKALIVLPTRDLAIQVSNVVKEYLPRAHASTLLIGGTSLSLDFRTLARNPQIIIGTPGRVVHHIQALKKLNVKYLVLDEVDRLLDIGFKKQYDVLMDTYPLSNKVFFSATLSMQLKQRISKSTLNPVIVDVGNAEHIKPTITEEFRNAQENQKFKILKETLPKYVSTVVFVNSNSKSRQITEKLQKEGVASISYTSNCTVNKRRKLLEAFTKGHVTCMVATDIAARGIDFNDLKLVVNYDVPFAPSDYIHRIGRTGRASGHGNSLTLVSRSQQKYAKNINNFRSTNTQIIQRPPSRARSFPRSGSRDISRSNGYRSSRPFKRF